MCDCDISRLYTKGVVGDSFAGVAKRTGGPSVHVRFSATSNLALSSRAFLVLLPEVERGLAFASYEHIVWRLA